MIGWLLLGLASAYEVADVDLENRSFDRLLVDVGGFVQPRFISVPEDEDANTVGTFGWAVQRVRLEIEGDLLAPEDQEMGFSVGQKFSIELIPEARLQDAYVNLAIGTPLQVRLGQMKAPIHRATLVSDANNLFPDRNQITDWFQDRDMGAMVHGYVGERHVEWQASVLNGEGTNRLGNVNRKFLYVGRIVFSPLGTPGSSWEILRDYEHEDGSDRPVVSAGYAVHYNVDGPPGQELAYIGHNVETFFHWKFLTAQGEYFYKFADWEQPAIPDFNQIGWYGQVGSFIEGVPWARDHLAVMGRVEQGDSLIAIDQEVLPSGPTDETQGSRRYSMGLGLYAGEPMFERVQDLRLVVSYTIREELEEFPFDNNELNISGNLNF